MAGLGVGLGSTNLTGIVNATHADNRAERQQAFKDRQIAIMEAEQEKQRQAYEQAGQTDVNKIVQSQQQEIKKLHKKQVGAVAKTAIAGAAVSPSSDNVAFDTVKKINANTDLQEALGVGKHEVRAFDPNAREDNTAFLKYLDKNGIDYTAWSPEYLQEVKNTVSRSGLYYNYKGDVIDSTPLVEATNSLAMANTDAVNIYEGKKAILRNMFKGEEEFGKFLNEALTEPRVASFFNDYVDRLPKSERDKLIARKDALSKMSNKQAGEELKEVAKETGMTEPATEVVSEGKPNTEVEPLAEPILDEEGNEIAVEAIAPDGSKVIMSNTKPEARTEDGTTVTRNPDGSGIAIAPDGTTTTFDSEKAVTVTQDGKIIEDYTLPPHVQMAYDMLGLKSSYSPDAVLNRELAEKKVEIAKIKAEKGKYAPSTLEKVTEYLRTSIDPNTGKLYTPERALEKAQNLMAGGKATQVKELEAMLETEKDPKKRKQIQEMIDAYAAGTGAVLRERKIADANTVGEFAETADMNTAVKSQLASTPEARTFRNKARNLENQKDFSAQEKKDLQDFKGEVRTVRQIASVAKRMEDMVASGEYKSGLLDTTGKKLVSYLPASVNEFLNTDDWYKSARLDKAIDKVTADYVRAISGLTVTDAEYSRLKNILGGDYTSEEARLADLKQFHQSLLDNVYAHGESLYNAGYVSSVPKELALLERGYGPSSKANESSKASKSSKASAPSKADYTEVKKNGRYYRTDNKTGETRVYINGKWTPVK